MQRFRYVVNHFFFATRSFSSDPTVCIRMRFCGEANYSKALPTLTRLFTTVRCLKAAATNRCRWKPSVDQCNSHTTLDFFLRRNSNHRPTTAIAPIPIIGNGTSALCWTGGVAASRKVAGKGRGPTGTIFQSA